MAENDYTTSGVPAATKERLAQLIAAKVGSVALHHGFTVIMVGHYADITLDYRERHPGCKNSDAIVYAATYAVEDYFCMDAVMAGVAWADAGLDRYIKDVRTGFRMSSEATRFEDALLADLEDESIDDNFFNEWAAHQ